MTDLVFSIVMLAALFLLLGAYLYWRRTGETKQPALMVLLAVIAIGNVLIWTVPTSDGSSPVDLIEAAETAEAQ